jgi:hypothetical protein
LTDELAGMRGMKFGSEPAPFAKMTERLPLSAKNDPKEVKQQTWETL